MLVLQGPAKHQMLYGGSRSGKTLLHCRNIAVRAIKAKKSRHAILRQRFNAVKESVALDTFPKMMSLCFPGVDYEINKSDWYARFPSDSEIWFGAEPPLGALQAARVLGRERFERLVVFTSLSKRSNVPGMRSGFVAGDAAILRSFLLYRTYHGSAMSPVVQAASIAAWGDEAHVEANRALYRAKFERVTPMLAKTLDVALPDAGFYLWAGVPSPHGRDAVGDDVAFARGLLAQYNVAVLPGSLLARQAHGINPGAGRIRMALVAGVDECVEAAERIAAYTKDLSK